MENGVEDERVGGTGREPREDDPIRTHHRTISFFKISPSDKDEKGLLPSEVFE